MTTSDTPSGKIIGLYTGKPKARWPGKPDSAIEKHAVDGPLAVDPDGFCDDIQADLTVHGGAEKALHHYASDHMNFWREKFPDHAHKFRSGCFGENIATTGLTEENLCFGDVLSFGTAKVEICQGRQPCWKLNAHMENDQLASQFQQTARTGWYYRVVENGMVNVGDQMSVLDRPHPEWALQRLIHARFNKNLDMETARELSNLKGLSQHWCDSFAKKSLPGFIEDTDKRLKGV